MKTLQKMRDLLLGRRNPPLSATPEWSGRTRRELADLCVEMLEQYPIPKTVLRSGKQVPHRRQSIGRIEVTGPERLTSDNIKLKGIVIWSLPAVTTCPSCADCKSSCFAMKSQVRSEVYRQRFENLYLWAEMPDVLEKLILRQIDTSPQVKSRRDFRIHVSGDFFSQEYVEWWAGMISEIGDRFRWYCYSKAGEIFDLSSLEQAGLNIVSSYMPDGSINFTPSKGAKGVEEAKVMLARAKSTGARVKICPATMYEDYKCGEKKWAGAKWCSWCLTNRHTIFVRH